MDKDKAPQPYGWSEKPQTPVKAASACNCPCKIGNGITAPSVTAEDKATFQNVAVSKKG
jgi:hypothetical protein